MKRVLAFLAFALASYVQAGELTAESASAETRRLLAEYGKGVFAEATAPMEQSGWMMDVHGKQRARSFLQSQAAPLVKLGRPAVPVLLERLEDKQRFIRYICAYSLQKITGQEPTFYYFGEPHKPFNGEADWFEKAHDVWRQWYDAQPTNAPYSSPAPQVQKR